MSLKQNELIAKKYYTRSKDPLASTEFTYTRFLVPAIMQYKGWAIFCDCDFIFFKNVLEILGLNRVLRYSGLTRNILSNKVY